MPFIDNPAIPAGFALGWFLSSIATWFTYVRERRADGQAAEKTVQNILSGFIVRFVLAIVALLIAARAPEKFHVLATGLGLLMPTVTTVIVGVIQAKDSTIDNNEAKGGTMEQQ
ncbi:ATP synthase I chain family protein [Heliorestis convoluta]|uniref:ATP synthase I chain family protein n=1 Tax=Heliorestis convoluta TaxID=356322 RepID=A0A5Q2MYP9_9FIRM|nr:ATP synthase I chain family protein [Heliorestis convoluta]